MTKRKRSEEIAERLLAHWRMLYEVDSETEHLVEAIAAELDRIEDRIDDLYRNPDPDSHK